jgi:hypothetical protein
MNIIEQLRIQRMYNEAVQNGKRPDDKPAAESPAEKPKRGRPKKASRSDEQTVQNLSGTPTQD